MVQVNLRSRNSPPVPWIVQHAAQNARDVLVMIDVSARRQQHSAERLHCSRRNHCLCMLRRSCFVLRILRVQYVRLQTGNAIQ